MVTWVTANEMETRLIVATGQGHRALFVVLVIIGIVLRVMWTRRRKKMKRVVHRHRAAALRGYHRPDCMKLDPARECNCKKEVGQEGYRCYDDDDSVPSGSPLWLGP